MSANNRMDGRTNERLFPSRAQELEKGHKTDSYLIAMTGGKGDYRPQPVPTHEPVIYEKAPEQVNLTPSNANPNIGLTKEELEKYRNDPCWKRVRLFLFILFWLVWIGLFVAAILIVILSPKCAAEYKPAWYQNQVCYQAWTPSFQDADSDGGARYDGIGDLIGFIHRLNKLRKLGLSAVWPRPLLTTQMKGGLDVLDFKRIEPIFGENSHFADLTDSAHSRDMRVVMDLPLAATTTSHEWFKKSVQKLEGFENAYLWGCSPASEYCQAETERKENYAKMKRDEGNFPLLNYDDDNTLERIYDVMKFWLSEPYKVDGFHVPHIEYLGRSADGTKPDWDKVKTVVGKLRRYLDEYKNETQQQDRQILLFSTVDKAVDGLVGKTGLHYTVDKSIRQRLEDCANDGDKLVACLKKLLDENVHEHEEGTTPLQIWQLGDHSETRIATLLGSRAKSELVITMQLMLPGASSFYYGDPLGMEDLPSDLINDYVHAQTGVMQWSADANAGFSTHKLDKMAVHPNYTTVNFDKQYAEYVSPLKVFRKLSGLRLRDETLMRGKLVVADTPHTSLLAFARYETVNGTLPHGNTAFVALLNFGDKEVVVKGEDLNQDLLPMGAGGRSSGIIVTPTSGITDETMGIRKPIDLTKSVTLPAYQGLVIRLTKEKKDE